MEMLASFDEDDASCSAVTDLKEDSRGWLLAMVPCDERAVSVE